MKIKRPAKHIITLCILTLFMVGCASVAPPAQNTQITWSDRAKSLQDLTRWQLNGKVAFRSPNDSGSASLRWTENANHYTLNLLAPLGAGGMTLTGNDHHLTLKTDDGKIQQAGNPSELLVQNGGPPLPVQNLRYWIRGLPAPFSPAAKQFDAYGRLSQLSQDGWQIDYLSYTHARGLDLPSRLNARSADINLKLIIYEWGSPLPK